MTRRKLTDALDFNRHFQMAHELESIDGDFQADDILAMLDVSQIDADGQGKKVTGSGLMFGVAGVRSLTTNISGATQLNNMVALTQAQYDAISSPDDATLYIIVT